MTVKLDIQLKRGGFRLDVQLSAPAGVTVIFGPSGSGKNNPAARFCGLGAYRSGPCLH